MTFEIYSTVYDEEILLNSYVYDFNDFTADKVGNDITIKGHLNDEYKNVDKFDVTLFTFDGDGSALETITREVENKSELEINISGTKDFASYYFTLTKKEYLMYQSEMLNVAPIIEFGTQQLTSYGLKVQATNIDSTSIGSITDINGNEIPLVFGDDYLIIPMFDVNGDKYNYTSYALTINGFNYLITPDDSLLYVKDFDVYRVNDKAIVSTNGFITFQKNRKLKVDVSQNNQVITSLYFDDNVLCNEFEISSNDGDTFTYKCYIVDEQDNILSEEIDLSSSTYNDEIDLSLQLNNGFLTANLNIIDMSDYVIKFNYYNSTNELIDTEEANFEFNGQVMEFTKSITSEVSSLTYTLIKGNRTLHVSNSFEKNNITFTSQTITDEGIVLYATGLNSNMTGTITASNDTVKDLVIRDECLIIPLLDDKNENITYNDYSMSITNGFDNTDITPIIQNQLIIRNVELHNNYYANGLQLEVYSVYNPDFYSIEAEAYMNGNLSTSESIDSVGINKNAFVFGGILNDSSNNSDTTFKIYLKDNINDVVTDLYEYNVLAQDKIPDQYTFSAVNAGEVLITYNDDSTINIYIPTEFECDDENIFERVLLGEEVYDSRDKVVAIENVENKTYPIIYKVMKQSTDIPVIYDNVAVSGAANENSVYLSATKIVEGTTNYAQIDVSNYVNRGYDSTKVFFEGHDNATYFEDSMSWKVGISDTDTTLRMHMYCSYSNFDSTLDSVLAADPNINIKGSYGREVILDLLINV